MRHVHETPCIFDPLTLGKRFEEEEAQFSSAMLSCMYVSMISVGELLGAKLILCRFCLWSQYCTKAVLQQELAKKSPCQDTCLGNRGPKEALNDIKLILNNLGSHSYSFRTNLVSFRTFRRPLFPKPVSWQVLFCHFLQQSSSSTTFSLACFRTAL